MLNAVFIMGKVWLMLNVAFIMDPSLGHGKRRT